MLLDHDHGRVFSAQDPRFNPEYDAKTGYRTRCMVCMPVFNYDGEVIGVAQIVNKKGEEEDEEEDETGEDASTEFKEADLKVRSMRVVPARSQISWFPFRTRRNDNLSFFLSLSQVFERYLTFCGIGIQNAQLFAVSILEYKKNQVRTVICTRSHIQSRRSTELPYFKISCILPYKFTNITRTEGKKRIPYSTTIIPLLICLFSSFSSLSLSLYWHTRHSGRNSFTTQRDSFSSSPFLSFSSSSSLAIASNTSQPPPPLFESRLKDPDLESFKGVRPCLT